MMSDDEFFDLCQREETFVLERTANGEIIRKSLPGWETSLRSTWINAQLGNWQKENRTGVGFGVFTGYKLGNGSVRAPYSSWVPRSTMVQLSVQQKKKFLPLCPDFAIELRSPSDDLDEVKAKMDEYIACGLRLGWLIDPEEKVVYVYRPNLSVEKLEDILEVSADPELPGFVLDLREVWDRHL
jgi:Uma2 family endonuclease